MPNGRRGRAGRRRKAGDRYPSGELKRVHQDSALAAAGVPMEREQHDRIERLTEERDERGEPRRLADASGNIADPFVVLDELRRLWRHGRITAEQLGAAERFRDDFALAGFIAIRAAALDVIPVSGRRPADPSKASMDARERVAAVMRKLGMRSTEASCAWHVLGREMKLAEWHRICRTWREPSEVLVATVTTIAEA